jgi:hypothetical protein
MFITRARTKPAKPVIGISAFVLLEKGLRGLEVDRFRPFCSCEGKNRDSLNSQLGRAKPLNSCLPNARIFISNLLCLGSRKTLVFLGFWGLSKNNFTLIWGTWKQVANPTF